jgi:AcrR family transcriptional regulator
MASPPHGKKAETHERIVRAAARAVRQHGYAGVNVADVMKDAGLTHGGFYAHFASREAMLAEALESAGAESLTTLGKATASVPPAEAIEAFVAAYLSDDHVGHAEAGCALAALGSETRRQPAELRRGATRRVKEMADLIARQLPGWAEADGRGDALGVMSSLVGAVVIARIVDDPALSTAIRQAAARFIRAGLAEHASPAAPPARRRKPPAASRRA